MEILGIALLMLLYMVSLYIDIKYLLVKNYLIYLVVFVSILFLLMMNGMLYLFTVILYMGLLLAVGLVLELLKVWRPGDTKLLTAGALASSVFLGSIQFWFLMLLVGSVFLVYIIAAHTALLVKSNFDLLLYYVSKKIDYPKIKLPCTPIIFVGNVIALVVWQLGWYM